MGGKQPTWLCTNTLTPPNSFWMSCPKMNNSNWILTLSLFFWKQKYRTYCVCRIMGMCCMLMLLLLPLNQQTLSSALPFNSFLQTFIVLTTVSYMKRSDGQHWHPEGISIRVSSSIRLCSLVLNILGRVLSSWHLITGETGFITLNRGRLVSTTVDL